MRRKKYVLKFGGTSVANVDRIKEVARRIAKHYKQGHKILVVVSAMGNTTDNLIGLAKKINPRAPEREMDMLVSTGEQITISLLAMAIEAHGIGAISFTGDQVGIITDTSHTQARIMTIKTDRVKKEWRKNRVVIVAGFQGIGTHQEITTLGRGGSDLSAVALAVALKADMCEIYTDVEGIYTADPRVIENARKIKQITFDEMLELASCGAQVMQTRAIEVAKKFNIPLHVRSSFSKKEGTIIMKDTALIEEPIVTGVTLTEKEAKITICAVPDKPGIAAGIFDKIASSGINIDMIVQNVGHRKNTDISFTVAKKSLDKAIKISRTIAKKINAGKVISDKNIAKISIVGVGMRARQGVAAKCFSVLAKNKINIEMISTSEISISCVIAKKSSKKALQTLTRVFKLTKKKRSSRRKSGKQK
jgi:aspartate kinase